MTAIIMPCLEARLTLQRCFSPSSVFLNCLISSHYFNHHFPALCLFLVRPELQAAVPAFPHTSRLPGASELLFSSSGPVSWSSLGIILPCTPHGGPLTCEFSQFHILSPQVCVPVSPLASCVRCCVTSSPFGVSHAVQVPFEALP